MTYIFDGEINTESVKDFIDFLNSAKGEDELRIYFTSPGGSVHESEIMIDVLDSLKADVHLILYAGVSSCAVDVVMKAKKAFITIMPTAYAMLHSVVYDVEVGPTHNPTTPLHRFVQDRVAPVVCKRWEDDMRSYGISEADIRKMKKDARYEVYWTADELNDAITKYRDAQYGLTK